MAGWLNRSRENERRRKRRWQVLGVLLLALAGALYWIDRKMAGRPGGHLGDWLPASVPGGNAHPAAAGTAPAGAEPMAGAQEEAPESVGFQAEPATVDVAQPAAESITTAPPFEARETGEAPEPDEWQEALAGEAPDDAPPAETADSGGDETVEESAGAKAKPDLTPSIASGWVEGDGTNVCPEGYPIKGNATSRIFHRPGESSYEVTRAEICFATEEDAESAGYRPRKR